ncbi:CDGSH iron-sulfur domain-containing protein [Streptomyces sp. NPDC008125]|uniref:CDGSH iron-sulfur domain-containing protein n=1 Tax=Streptomyces sp. NPDC008125 TaxID=3364811 RepID=UPI0036EC2E9B
MTGPGGETPAGAPRARLVTVVPGGPVLIEGPVTVRMPDGRAVTSERFTTAVCTCRRSRAYPWCDTSHRRRERESAPPDEPGPKQATAGHRPAHPSASEETTP